MCRRHTARKDGRTRTTGPGAITRRLVGGIRENLTERLADAEQHGRLVGAEGLRVSLVAARDELAQLDRRARRAITIDLGIPTYGATSPLAPSCSDQNHITPLRVGLITQRIVVQSS